MHHVAIKSWSEKTLVNKFLLQDFATKEKEFAVSAIGICSFVPKTDFYDLSSLLTLKDPFISESCIEIKIELNFYFYTSLSCLKRFYEGAFTKPFKAPQRSVKLKI